jgi:hypothetical protein
VKHKSPVDCQLIEVAWRLDRLRWVPRVRSGPGQLAYDLGFLALGAVLVIAGTGLGVRGGRCGRCGGVAAAVYDGVMDRSRMLGRGRTLNAGCAPLGLA